SGTGDKGVRVVSLPSSQDPSGDGPPGGTSNGGGGSGDPGDGSGGPANTSGVRRGSPGGGADGPVIGAGPGGLGPVGTNARTGVIGGTGTGGGTGKITLPIGGPGGIGDGPGGDGEPGQDGQKATAPPTKPQPQGVYVHTTGDFDFPLAITQSDYGFNEGSVRKVLDEINGRTK